MLLIGREEKTAVLAELISKTNAAEMRWILMIILKGKSCKDNKSDTDSKLVTNWFDQFFVQLKVYTNSL